MGIKTPYLYQTKNGGKSWTPLAKDPIKGYALSVRQDLVNPDLLFLGTEFGLYISLDGGQGWARFENNLPKVGVRDMVIHPRDHALVMGTHGRGIILIDDISPLRQLNKELLSNKVAFLKMPPFVLRDPGAGGNWFGGAANFVGPNPSNSAQIAYYLNRRHNFGKMYIEVWENGKLLRTLSAGKRAGINIVEMPTALDKPKAPPTRNRMALQGSLFGPNLKAGTYEIKLVKGKETYESNFQLLSDPKAPYKAEDRALQHQTVMKLYHMTEHLAYQYEVLDQIEKKAETVVVEKKKLQEQLTNLITRSQNLRNKLVALEGDFYVDSGEEIYERISDLYRQISGYPGRPSDSQLSQAKTLERNLEDLNKAFQQIVEQDLAGLNKGLEKAKVQRLTIPEKADFLRGSSGGGSSRSGRHTEIHYQTLVGGPLGWQYLFPMMHR